MHNINTSVLIKAPKELVFSLLKDMSQYPKFMRYVKSIEVKKISEQEMISKWSVDIEGADVIWEEKDIFDNKNMEMSFSMIQGDYSKYYGKWKIEPSGEKTRLSLNVYVDWGIPIFEKFVDPILKRKTRVACVGMLKAIKKEVEYKGC